MNKRIVITGVSGFIGKHVAQEAARRGYNVTGIGRPQECCAEAFDFISADIRDKDRMIQAMRDQDCVIHLAAVTSNVEFIKAPRDCYDINTNGFLNVIDAAAKGGCKRFVYASSSAVYRDSFSEHDVLDFRTQNNHYAKTKMMNEMTAKSYEDIYTMRTTGLRYFNVYGYGENEKGDYASIITLFRRARKNSEPLTIYGDGKQARDLIHVVDVANITLDLLEKGSCPVYNVGTGIATAYSTIAEIIDKHHIKYVPNPLASYQLYTRADTTRLKQILGDYKFTELEKGIDAIRV